MSVVGQDMSKLASMEKGQTALGSKPQQEPLFGKSYAFGATKVAKSSFSGSG